jgi:hypothetical protein
MEGQKGQPHTQSMTKATRRQAPEERAAIGNPATPHSMISQAIPMRTTPTPYSPLQGNRNAQQPPPTKTRKTKKCNLEKPGPHLNTLETTLMQYIPSVHETHQAPPHTQSTVINSLNHHTSIPHPRNHKRPRMAPDPTPTRETHENTTSPNTQKPTYVKEKTHTTKRP